METISKGEFADSYSDIHVSWNVNDWPTVNFEDPALVYRNIELSLRKEGYCGNLSVTAYGDIFKSMSEDMMKQYWHAGFFFDEGDDSERLQRMLEDVPNWTWKLGRSANLVVLSNISEDVELVYLMKSMKSRGHNVVFARKSRDDSDSLGLSQTGIREWICPDLLDKSLEEIDFAWTTTGHATW
ncbi:unnamed protein product [Microthlaspi erraticum]|uniref:NYN domain-containing protein n=1 Tax=Microthlaspi erraticum TaxID=1685480 RepID=A0A6D2IW83_9BRAS|nr:unnamed protein product [Microthlaspi erraticum]